MAKALFISLGWFLLAQIYPVNVVVADDDIEQGRKQAGQCKTCHGSHGIAKIPIAPNIAGEPEQYIISQLNAYRTGERQHEMMTVVANTLNDDSIAQLAKWYASQTISATVNDETADHSAISNCIECHGIDGMGIHQDAPHLAGESVIYIDTQLKAFRLGKRKHEVMSEIASELTDEQIREISEWYSSVKFDVVK